MWAELKADEDWEKGECGVFGMSSVNSRIFMENKKFWKKYKI